MTLHSLNLLPKLDQQGIQEIEVQKHQQAPLIVSILKTLECAGLVVKNEKKYFFTQDGKELYSRIGLLRMLFEGYGSLMANQDKIAKNTLSNPSEYMRSDVIAESSINFSQGDLDILYKNFFQRYQPTGTVCDLGCGNAKKLIEIQKLVGNPGFGIEKDEELVNTTSEWLNQADLQDIEVQQSDITQLDLIREDVTTLIQQYVFHDFVPNEKCSQLIDAMLESL